MKQCSTATNINHFMIKWIELKARRKSYQHESAAVVFFDFNKTYNYVPRDLLLRKLTQFNIPWIIVKAIKNTLNNFKLHYNDEIIVTKGV